MSNEESEPGLRATVELDPHLCLAAHQNAVPFVRRIRLENPGDQDVRDVTLRVSADPEVFTPWTLHISEVHAGTTWSTDRADPRLSTDRLRSQAERERGQLQVVAEVGDQRVASVVSDIVVLPPRHWPGLGSLPELLAAWILPNHGALEPVLVAATDRLRAATGRASLSGYQSRDPKRVAQTCQALYEALAASGVRYSDPPASFEARGQKVRLPDEVIGGLGTCLGLSLVLAGVVPCVYGVQYAIVIHRCKFIKRVNSCVKMVCQDRETC